METTSRRLRPRAQGADEIGVVWLSRWGARGCAQSGRFRGDLPARPFFNSVCPLGKMAIISIRFGEHAHPREGTSWITVQIGRQIPASDLSSNDQNSCWRQTPKLRKGWDGWHIEQGSIQTDAHPVEPDGREGRTQRDGDGCSASDEGHGFRPSGGIGQVQ